MKPANSFECSNGVTLRRCPQGKISADLGPHGPLAAFVTIPVDLALRLARALPEAAEWLAALRQEQLQETRQEVQKEIDQLRQRADALDRELSRAPKMPLEKGPRVAPY